MNEAQEHPAELEALLGPPGEAESSDDLDLGALYADVRARVDDEKPAEKMRALSSPRRYLMAFFAFGIVLGLTVGVMPRADLGSYPPHLLAAYLGSLGVLFVLALLAALRPVHLPPLPRWQNVGLTVLAIVATCVLAVVPGLRDHVTFRLPESAGFWMQAKNCIGYGLLIGLPVYGALRLLDRGNPLGRLLSAAAAGLCANMMLEMHCPVGGAQHLLATHASVLVIFVVGVLVAEALAHARR